MPSVPATAAGAPTGRRLSHALSVAAFFWFLGTTHAADKPVNVIKTPDDGIQPQALMDAKGVLHLLYYKGKASGGDLYYVRREPGRERFSEPIRVNSIAGSAIATGTIRGGQIALGKDGRVHVAWNGLYEAAPKEPTGTPMYYARMSDAGAAFEPQRNLMHVSSVLDGGGTVTADAEGNVVVAWHGLKLGGETGEDNRKVWVARSTDDGKNFAVEKPATDKPTGACGCCGMRGFTDSKGRFVFLYRGATEKIHRDMFLLISADHGQSFDVNKVHPWEINACPMSSEAFAEGPDGVYAAWETDGQIYFAPVDPAKGVVGKVTVAPGRARDRKHPALAINGKGEILLAWTEGTGWQKGGALAWQVFDKKGNPTDEKGRLADGIPVWGLPAVVVDLDGKFLIIH
jgi:hypothetical protein